MQHEGLSKEHHEHDSTILKVLKFLDSCPPQISIQHVLPRQGEPCPEFWQGNTAQDFPWRTRTEATQPSWPLTVLGSPPLGWQYYQEKLLA